MKAIEIKMKARAKEYIESGMNATAMVLKERPSMSANVAKVRGHEIVTNPNFQKALLDTMAEKGLNDEVVIQAHKENIEQSINLPARNTAIDMYYKVKQVYNENTSNHLHIHTSPADIQNKLKEIESELNTLDGK